MSWFCVGFARAQVTGTHYLAYPLPCLVTPRLLLRTHRIRIIRPYIASTSKKKVTKVYPVSLRGGTEEGGAKKGDVHFRNYLTQAFALFLRTLGT